MDVLIILLMAMVLLIAVVGGLGLAITMSLNVLERMRWCMSRHEGIRKKKVSKS